MSHPHGISILIRTSDSERPLRRLLKQLQLTPGDEIILVDTGSKDGTVALAEQAGVKIVRNEKPFNYSHTLNLGFQVAKNDRVLVLSVHCEPVNRDFLEIYRQALAQLPEDCAVIYGMQAFSRHQFGKLDKAVKILRAAEAGTLGGGGNPNALYSRRAWAMHPFDETLPTGEDFEWKNWASKNGLILATAAEACVFYRHPGGPTYRFKKAHNEARIGGQGGPPMSIFELAINVAHTSKHLLWEEFLPKAWLGQVAHALGGFAASRCPKRPD